jgi:hypothetical protein
MICADVFQCLGVRSTATNRELSAVGREQGVGDGVGNHGVSEEAFTIEGGGETH